MMSRRRSRGSNIHPPPGGYLLKKLREGKFYTTKQAERMLKHITPEAKDMLQIKSRIMEKELERQSMSLDDWIYHLTPNGWFKEYLDYTISSESPDVFHLFASLALVSHTIGRSIKFYLPGQTIYAPISVFLCSPAGKAQRGQSIGIMSKVAIRANAEVETDTVTPEALVDLLSKRAHILFISEEASLMLSKKDYQSDATQVICRLLDGDDHYGINRRVKSGKTNVNKSTLNMLLTSSPKMFESMNPAAIGGGLMSRMILVWASNRGQLAPFPEKIMQERELIERANELAKDLVYMRKSYTGFNSIEFPTLVRQFYEQWYADNDDEGSQASESMSHWYSRKAGHVLRILMCFMAANGYEKISQDHLDRVLAILETIEPGIEGIYSRMSDNPFEKKRNMILETMNRHGKEISVGDLWPRVKHGFRDNLEFKETIRTLQEFGMIMKISVKGKGTRPVTMYKLLG